MDFGLCTPICRSLLPLGSVVKTHDHRLFHQGRKDSQRHVVQVRLSLCWGLKDSNYEWSDFSCSSRVPKNKTHRWNKQHKWSLLLPSSKASAQAHRKQASKRANASKPARNPASKPTSKRASRTARHQAASKPASKPASPPAPKQTRPSLAREYPLQQRLAFKTSTYNY
jgi:hypothetical protein